MIDAAGSARIKLGIRFMDQYIEFLGNHYMLTTAWIVLFFLFITSFVGAAMSSVKLVSTHDMTLLVNRENAKVVDTRPVADFNKGDCGLNRHSRG